MIQSLSVRAHKAMKKANPDVGLLQFLSSDEEDAYKSRRKAALQPMVQALRDHLAAHATQPQQLQVKDCWGMLWQVSPLADDAPLEADLAAYRPKPLIKPPSSRRTLRLRSGGKLLVHKT